MAQCRSTAALYTELLTLHVNSLNICHKHCSSLTEKDLAHVCNNCPRVFLAADPDPYAD